MTWVLTLNLTNLNKTDPKLGKPAASPLEGDSHLMSEASNTRDEGDGKGEGAESKDKEEDPNNGDNSPGEPLTAGGPETPNPELMDDANNMEVDIVSAAPTAVTPLYLSWSVTNLPSLPPWLASQDRPLPTKHEDQICCLLGKDSLMPLFPQKMSIHSGVGKNVMRNSKWMCSLLILLKPSTCL